MYNNDETNFDFKNIAEQGELIDNQKFIPCRHCRKFVPADALLCLYCGKETTGSNKKLWIIITAVIVLLIFLWLLFAAY
jgi:hypothetical protein